MRARSANACGAPCLRVSAVNSIFSAASSTIATARPFAIPASLRQRRENVNDLSIMTLGGYIIQTALVSITSLIGRWRNFDAHYQTDKRTKRPITKEAIFHYVYGLLHDPVYREKYAQNLKREFPRIPFYADFWHWADWGEKLMALHIGYETVEPWPLKRIDVPDEKARKAGLAPRAMLSADKDTGNIVLDSETQLTGVPQEAWDYRLGNRSALEWILDQYKEKTPKDPTIREKFNTYRFADHKEKVIDLLKRVTRVSVETMRSSRRCAWKSVDLQDDSMFFVCSSVSWRSQWPPIRPRVTIVGKVKCVSGRRPSIPRPSNG